MMTNNETAVVCPHCGFDHPATLEWPKAAPQEIRCVACGKPFRCWADRSRTVFTYHAEAI
jgi:DNA-directed RNA polymerase subunit RPC12/RpoP